MAAVGGEEPRQAFVRAVRRATAMKHWGEKSECWLVGRQSDFLVLRIPRKSKGGGRVGFVEGWARDLDLVSDLREAPTITQRNAKSRRQNDACLDPSRLQTPLQLNFWFSIQVPKSRSSPASFDPPRF